jgi:hypothetical protein
MGRSATIVGLSKRALTFLRNEGKTKSVNSCEHCGHCSGKELVSQTYETIEVFVNEDYQLQKWRLKDGRIAKEVVQCIPWDSGPILYTCLEIDGVRKFLHNEDEVLGIKKEKKHAKA